MHPARALQRMHRMCECRRRVAVRRSSAQAARSWFRCWRRNRTARVGRAARRCWHERLDRLNRGVQHPLTDLKRSWWDPRAGLGRGQMGLRIRVVPVHSADYRRSQNVSLNPSCAWNGSNACRGLPNPVGMPVPVTPCCALWFPDSSSAPAAAPAARHLKTNLSHEERDRHRYTFRDIGCVTLYVSTKRRESGEEAARGCSCRVVGWCGPARTIPAAPGDAGIGRRHSGGGIGDTNGAAVLRRLP